MASETKKDYLINKVDEININDLLKEAVENNILIDDQFAAELQSYQFNYFVKLDTNLIAKLDDKNFQSVFDAYEWNKISTYIFNLDINEICKLLLTDPKYSDRSKQIFGRFAVKFLLNPIGIKCGSKIYGYAYNHEFVSIGDYTNKLLHALCKDKILVINNKILLSEHYPDVTISRDVTTVFKSVERYQIEATKLLKKYQESKYGYVFEQNIQNFVRDQNHSVFDAKFADQ